MRKLILLVCGLGFGTAVQAADNGIYIGASVGQSNVDIDLGYQFDEDDVGFKVIAGIRPLDWLGFEASYVDLGKPKDDSGGASVESEGYAFSGFVVGFLPLGPVDAFAKVGGVKWNQELKYSGLTSEDIDGTDLAYGVGVQFRLLSLGVRAEYEVFDPQGDDFDDLYDSMTLLSVGVTYTFL